MRYHARHPLRMQEPMHVQMPVEPERVTRGVLDRWWRGGRFRGRARACPAQPNLVPDSDRENQMPDPYNGIPASQLSDVRWRKSRRSNPSGNCVELAELPDGTGVALRNSRDPEGPALIYTTEEIEAFILGARDGDFDSFVA
jgi:hypothetical protein